MSSFQEMMKQLTEDYIAGLPSKISEIETRLSAAHVTELREDFHKLKRTGKTYGLPEVSQLAELVEKICIVQPERAVEAASQGVELLRKIHIQRAAQQSLNLTSEESFRKIQQIAA